MNRQENLTSVILACWNGLELTKVCIKQIFRWTTSPFELILVDNGSRDGTSAWLNALELRKNKKKSRGAFQGIYKIRNPSNLGYAAAMNQGIRLARGDCLVFGNNDAAVTPFWLEEMLKALNSGPSIGGVSPCCNPPRAAGVRMSWSFKPWYRGLRGMEYFARTLSLKTASPPFVASKGFVPGFWFAAKRQALEKAGLFDLRFYPGGYTDWDLQWRMRQKGYSLGFAVHAYVHHIWFGCSEKNGAPFADIYNLAKKKLLFKKHPRAFKAPFVMRTPLETVVCHPSEASGHALPESMEISSHARGRSNG